jgi:hypothetical protein
MMMNARASIGCANRGISKTIGTTAAEENAPRRCSSDDAQPARLAGVADGEGAPAGASPLVLAAARAAG